MSRAIAALVAVGAILTAVLLGTTVGDRVLDHLEAWLE